LPIEVEGKVNISGRHAPLVRRLFKAAQANNALEQVTKDLTKFGKWYNDPTDQSALQISNGILQSEKRNATLQESLKTLGLMPAVAQFMSGVINDNNGDLVNDLVKDFQDLSRVVRNEVTIVLTSAEPLTGESLERARRQANEIAAEKFPGANFIFQTKVNPSIVGGLQLQVGPLIQDLSLEREFVVFEKHVARMV